MNKNITYCHICGKISDRDDLYRLVITDLESKKRKTLYQTCGKCMHNIENRRYKMTRIANPKNLKFYGVSTESVATNKIRRMYDIFDTQLEVLKKLEVKPENLKITTKDNKRIWTVFNVRNLIEKNDVEMLKLMCKLFEYQTDDEKKARRTKWQNAVGFNQADANFLTGMSEKYNKQGKTKDVFTDRQLYAIRKRMLKYAQQITIILNS